MTVRLIRTFGGAAVLRIWFFVVTCIVSVYALLAWPAASPAFTSSAQSGDYIKSAVLSSPQTLAAPLPLMADGDIQQPSTYIPHVMPGEELASVESIPESAPVIEETEIPDSVDDDSSIDYSGEWYIPPEAYNSYVITPENTPPSVVPSLGYSGISDPSTELEYLASINTNVSLIIYLITVVLAAGIVYLICRAVWPLFRG